MLDTCPYKDDIPRSKRFDKTNREYNHHQEARSRNDDLHGKSDDDEVATRPCWSGMQLHAQPCMNGIRGLNEDDRSNILDSGSTISLFKSKNLVTEIKNAKDKIELETKGGTRVVDKEGRIKGFGKAYFNQNAIVNIFAVKDLVKKHRVTYDSDKEDTFVVHIGSNPSSFVLTNRDYTFLISRTATWII